MSSPATRASRRVLRPTQIDRGVQPGKAVDSEFLYDTGTCIQGFFRVRARLARRGGFPDVRFYQAQPITKFLVSELWFGNITEKFMNFELCVMLGG